MVSGFFTSPLDQERMISGEARAMETWSTWLTLSRPSYSRAFSREEVIWFLFPRQRLRSVTLGQRGEGVSGSQRGIRWI